MKRIQTLTLAVFLLIATAAMADVEGSWTASTSDEKPGRIHFNMTRGNFNNFGHTFSSGAFSGLTDAQINANTQTPVTFELRREAGTISYDGVFRNGKGAGHFTFAANRNYANTIRGLGIKFDTDRGRKKSEDEELFTLAALDVSTDFIRSIRAEGFDELSLDKYVEMRIFNVTPDYIREMRGLGYKDITVNKLVETKIHKVTPDYIRKMRASGWDLSLNKYVEYRIHGVTPEFADEMKKIGYNLDHSDLVAFRIHRVTPEFIEEIAKLGYKNVDADDLVAMRIHRVTPEFIRELETAGYRNVPVEKLIAMRIHGVDAKFIKRMNDVD
jgi:hypothetical protein